MPKYTLNYLLFQIKHALIYEQAYILLFIEKFGCVNMQVHTPVFNTNRCGIPTCTIHRHVVLTIVYNPIAGVTD